MSHQIRFIVDNERTGWFEETSFEVPRDKVAQLRAANPDAEIRVERSSIIPRKKQTIVRFKIQEKDDYTYYSTVFPVEQQEIKLAEIQARHPNAEIIPEVRDV